MRKLAYVFFEDGLRGLGRWRVKKEDCCHVLMQRLRDAGELLCQHPHTDAGMACREPKFDKLSCPPFDAAQSSRKMSVCSFQSKTGNF